MSSMFRTNKQVWCWPSDVVALVFVGGWVRGVGARAPAAGSSLTYTCALAEAQGGEGEEDRGGARGCCCRGAGLP